jgi:AcrR family transcriptional regulator
VSTVVRQETSRQRRASETREALVEAALHAFCEYGYAAASLDAIAGRAGFTKGALYSHFANKDALFMAVATQKLDEFNAQLELLVGADDVPRALGAWLGALMRDERRWLLANAEFTIACAQHPEHAWTESPERAEFTRNLGRVVGAPDAGVFVLSLINGLIIHASTRPDFDVESVLTQGVSLLQEGTP